MLGADFRRYRKFYSYRYGKVKAGGLFKVVLKALGRRPWECVFVDDNIKNVRAARKLGIRAIRFTSNGRLFAEMRKHGIRI